MSMIEVTRDVKNPLLSRRDITCTFRGLAGRLKRMEAAEMITKEFNLKGKIVIPINMKNDTGRPLLSGSFYVYDDEKLAREHLKEAIFKRIEKEAPPKAEGEAAQAEAPPAGEKEEAK